MATLTLLAIVDRFQAVLEAAPFSLKKTKEPFSHDGQPNTALDDAYRLEDLGLRTSRSSTNLTAVRVDGLRVWIARKLAFDGQAAIDTVETQLVAIERYLKADGRQQGYHAELTGRGLKRRGDIVTANIDFAVDYDFSEAVP